MNQEKHFLLTNRQTRKNGPNKIINKGDNWDTSGKLHFAALRVSEAVPVVEEWTDDADFEKQVVNQVKNLPEKKKNVVIYFHGYYGNLFPGIGSLMYKVFSGMKAAYCKDDQQGIGCLIHFNWPSHGNRELLDDDAYQQGKNLYQINHQRIKKLKQALAANGVNARLHLMGHSFAMQFFNGFASQIQNGHDKLFDRVFLFAPDLPYESIEPGGVSVLDPSIQTDAAGIESRTYDITKFNVIANQVHVFFNEFDYLLYGSTQLKLKSIKKRMPDELNSDDKRKHHSRKHTVLGVIGGTNGSPARFEFHDVHNRLKPTEKAFQYRNPAKLKGEIKREYEAMLLARDPDHYNFKKIRAKLNAATSGLTNKRKISAHRLMFSTDKVITAVKGLL